MYFRLYFKPERRPHPKRLFDIVNIELDSTDESSPAQCVIRMFRKSGKLTLEYIYSRPSIDGTYRIIMRREAKDYHASDLEVIQECNMQLIPMAYESPPDIN